MQTLLGIVIGASATAILAGLASDFPNLKFWEKLPEWSQAVGTVGAIFATIWIAHRDRENTRTDAADLEYKTRVRLVAALRSEIIQAVGMASTHLTTAQKIAERPPTQLMKVSSMMITRGEVYASVGSWIGTLPQIIVTEVVNYYNTIGQAEHVSMYAPDVAQMYAALKVPLTNIAVIGEYIAELLKQYLEQGCGEYYESNISTALIHEWADKHLCSREKAETLFNTKPAAANVATAGVH